jgi:hypothetical protein
VITSLRVDSTAIGERIPDRSPEMGQHALELSQTVVGDLDELVRAKAGW